MYVLLECFINFLVSRIICIPIVVNDKKVYSVLTNSKHHVIPYCISIQWDVPGFLKLLLSKSQRVCVCVCLPEGH